MILDVLLILCISWCVDYSDICGK